MTPKSLFIFFAKSEAVTWALLISALLLRELGDPIPLGVTVAGSIHGAVFLGYAVTAVLVSINQRFSFAKSALAVGLAIVPFATIPFEKRLLSSGSLEGSWRTAGSPDPRDSHWFDRLFRWFIARPLVLIPLLVIAIPGIFVFLLFLGPPTEWFK